MHRIVSTCACSQRALLTYSLACLLANRYMLSANLSDAEQEQAAGGRGLREMCYRSGRSHESFFAGYCAAAGGVAARARNVERSGTRGAGGGECGGTRGAARVPDGHREQLACGAERGGAVPRRRTAGVPAGRGGAGLARDAAAGIRADRDFAERAQRGDRAASRESAGKWRGGHRRDERAGRNAGAGGAISAGVRDGDGPRDFRGDVHDAGADGGIAGERGSWIAKWEAGQRTFAGDCGSRESHCRLAEATGDAVAGAGRGDVFSGERVEPGERVRSEAAVGRGREVPGNGDGDGKFPPRAARDSERRDAVGDVDGRGEDARSGPGGGAGSGEARRISDANWTEDSARRGGLGF